MKSKAQKLLEHWQFIEAFTMPKEEVRRNHDRFDWSKLE